MGKEKKSIGSILAKSGAPAKAGRRKQGLVAKRGKHLTTPEMRKYARWLSNFGVFTSHEIGVMAKRPVVRAE